MTSLAVALICVLAQTPDEVDAGAPAETLSKALAPSIESKPVESKPVEAPKTQLPMPWYQRVSIGGFARVQAGYTFPFRDEALVGGNGGFRVADFRLNLDFRPVDRLTVFTSVELAAPLGVPEDPLTGRRIVELRDAYIQYDVCSGLLMRAGQFRPSYDAEMLMGDGALPFTNRSVLATGLAPPEGYGPRQALAPDRQIGVQLGSKRLGSETLGVKYAVGLFNGAGQNVLFNDNNGLMPVARVEVDFLKLVTLGLNASYNVRSEGVRPNRLYTSSVNYGVDVETRMPFKQDHELSVMLVLLGRSTTFSFGDLPGESAWGGMVQMRYLHEPTGLEAALRNAYYEPSSQQVSDEVNELTAMVGWRPFRLPFRVLAQYTNRSEAAAVGYANDSVDVMLHAVW